MQKRRDDALQALGGPGGLRVVPAVIGEEPVSIDRKVHREAPDSAVAACVRAAKKADWEAQFSRNLPDGFKIVRFVQAEPEHA